MKSPFLSLSLPFFFPSIVLTKQDFFLQKFNRMNELTKGKGVLSCTAYETRTRTRTSKHVVPGITET